MAEVLSSERIVWTTGKSDDGSHTAQDFCEQASGGIYDFLSGTSATNAGIVALSTALKAAIPVTRWRTHTPWTVAKEDAEGGNLPCLYIWTQVVGQEHVETQTVWVTCETRLTILTEHADLETAVIAGNKYAQWIIAMLHQAPYAKPIISATANTWIGYYYNVKDQLEPRIDTVELTGDEERAPVYGVQVVFNWRHWVQTAA